MNIHCRIKPLSHYLMNEIGPTVKVTPVAKPSTLTVINRARNSLSYSSLDDPLALHKLGALAFGIVRSQ